MGTSLVDLLKDSQVYKAFCPDGTQLGQGKEQSRTRNMQPAMSLFIVSVNSRLERRQHRELLAIWMVILLGLQVNLGLLVSQASKPS